MQNDKWDLYWSEDFASGNEELDFLHKIILENIVKLYTLCSHSNSKQDEIVQITEDLQNHLINHFDIEINYLKENSIENLNKHEQKHQRYKDELELYKKHHLPIILHAILINELANDYMRKHFFKYDLKSFEKIKEKQE